MNLGDLHRLIRTNTKQHLPAILSLAAGVGVLATAYLTGKASFQASEIISSQDEDGKYNNRKEQFIGRAKLVWKLYIPAAASAATTITCIIGANRVEAKKTLAAQAAFAFSQRTLSEYRDKVIEEYGERKDQTIRDQIADERVKKELGSSTVVVAGGGDVLCCELFTGRFFTSDMETLRRAQNDINQKMLGHDYATMSDFYYIIGLATTSYSSQIGWESGKQMNLEFSTTLTEDGKPCLAFEYNYTKQF